MIDGLKQFVPSEVCLKCDGCCRFKEKESLWRPKIAKEEIERLSRHDLFSKIFSKSMVEKNGYIKTTSCGSGHQCHFFENKTNTCRIYGERPFECQLYPFVLTKNKGEVAVDVHHHCPYVQEHRNTQHFQDYADYLKQFFKREDVRNFMAGHSHLVSDYSSHQDELEFLFSLD